MGKQSVAKEQFPTLPLYELSKDGNMETLIDLDRPVTVSVKEMPTLLIESISSLVRHNNNL